MTEIVKKPRTKPTGKNKKPPANAADILRDFASRGANQTTLCRSVGVSRELFLLWLEQYPELKQAIDEGREMERASLHSALYDSALTGNTVAAIFLLKCRHAYDDRAGQGDNANRVSINFQLPGAMKMDQFRQMVDVTPKPEALTDD